MNKKITGLVLLIVGVIALIGAGVFVYVLTEFSTALGMLTSTDTAAMSQFGIDVGQMGSIIETVNMVLTIGFVWLITVIITALFSIYAGIKMLFKKR